MRFKQTSVHHQEVNCVNTASGIVTRCKWPSGMQVKQEFLDLHTGLCVKLVTYRKLYRDARSAKYKKRQPKKSRAVNTVTCKTVYGNKVFYSSCDEKEIKFFFMYRVIHKSLRDFRTRLRNNQDRHGRKEHINR